MFESVDWICVDCLCWVCFFGFEGVVYWLLIVALIMLFD